MSNNPNKNVAVTIDSVSVVGYIFELEVTETRNGITTASITMDHRIVNYINIRNGLEVSINFNYVNEPGNVYNKFFGFINNIQDGVDTIILSCVDPLWKCSGETLTKVYKESDAFGGDPALILPDMYGYVNLVADSSSIDPTPIVLPEITCDSSYIAEKTKTIIDALNWDEHYNPVDNKVYVSNPNLYITNSTPFTVGSNVIDLPDYNDNIFQTINEIELQGVSSASAYQETFNGDGSTVIFTLGRTPLSTYIYVTVGGVEQIGSVDGALATFDYLINKQQGFIEFQPGSIPATGTGNVVINYTATELTSITVDDETSQTANTKRKIVITVKDAITIDDALVRAKALMVNSKNSYYTFSCNVINTLAMGTHEKVDYNDQTTSTYITGMYVNAIKWRWPAFYDEYTLGTEPFDTENMFYNTEERVRRLERKRQEGQILTINKLSSSDINLYISDIVIKEIALDALTNVSITCDDASQVGSDLFWTDVANIHGAGTSSIDTGTSNDLLCYITPATILSNITALDNSKIEAISIDIIGITTGVGDTSISSIQLMKNYIPVGDELTTTDSFTTSTSTITVGSSTENWGISYDYNDIVREGFGVKIKFINGATTLDIDSVSINIHYRPILSSTDIVKGATKFVQADYDAGTTSTLADVIYTTAVDELEINTTI